MPADQHSSGSLPISGDQSRPADMQNGAVQDSTRDEPLAVIADAISWSNANLSFDEGAVEEEVAADILRGLRHLGWKLVRQ